MPSVSRTEATLERIRVSLIGDDLVLPGPFGPRRLVYADRAASGRALSFVETVFDYLLEAVASGPLVPAPRDPPA